LLQSMALVGEICPTKNHLYFRFLPNLADQMT